MDARSEFTTVQGRRIEVRRIAGPAPEAPVLVFLHEGLGSVSMWRDFPQRVARAAGCAALLYSRYGYGRSDVLEAPFGVRYMHDEALTALPELLDRLAIAEPILFGHSDGGSIALIHAGAGHRVRALVLEAPHVFVEDLSVRSIAQAKTQFDATDLRERLARHHADAARTFRGWNDIWLHSDFRRWNIEEYLPAISCPVLAIQGEDDEYGTMAQLDAIRTRVRGRYEELRLDRCGHSPHRDRPDEVTGAVVRFVRGVSTGS